MIKQLICSPDSPNVNGVTLSYENMKAVIADFLCGMRFGTLGYVPTMDSNIHRAALVVNSIECKDDLKEIWVDFTLLETPDGKLASENIDQTALYPAWVVNKIDHPEVDYEILALANVYLEVTK